MFELNTVKEIYTSMFENFLSLSLPATLLASFFAYVGCSSEAFLLWVVISTADMVFGVILAIVEKRFCAKRLYRWMFKIFIQLSTIALFAFMLRMITIAAGIEIFLASWLLLFFALMDFSAIMEKFLRLGYLPKPAQLLLGLMRKRSAKVFAAMVNEPELEKQMREALGEKEVHDYLKKQDDIASDSCSKSS